MYRLPFKMTLFQLAKTIALGSYQKKQNVYAQRLVWNFKVSRVIGLNISKNQENPPVPGIPRLVSSRFNSIRLIWNTTGIHNTTAVRYILEVDFNWTYHENVFVRYPYIEKYRLIEATVHTVDKLLANKSYKFRVAAVTLNGSSLFSEWSNLTPTNKSCEETPCHVTNVRLDLTSYTDREYRGLELNGIFRWKPTTGLTKHPYPKSYIEIRRLSTEELCNDYFDGAYEKEMEEVALTNKSRSFHTFVNSAQHGIRARLYFGCVYSVEIWHAYGIRKEAIGSWTFKIPFCAPLLKGCGCKKILYESDRKSVSLNLIWKSENTSSVIVTWSDESWTNVTYYGIKLHPSDNEKWSYVYQKKNIHNYNRTFSNLQNNLTYKIEIYAFDKNNCTFKEIKSLQFPDPTKPERKTNTWVDVISVSFNNKKVYEDEIFDRQDPTKPERKTNLGIASNGNVVDIVVPTTVIIAIAIIVMVGFYVRKLWKNRKAEINILYSQRNIIGQWIAHATSSDAIEFSREQLFESGDVIGEGAFGNVVLGQAYGISGNEGWTIVAIKKLRTTAGCDDMDKFFDEIKLMKRLGKHKNVIEMHGCCTLIQPVCIIMEYASHGSLRNYLKCLKQKNNSEPIFDSVQDKMQIGESKEISNEFVSFARQIANGMAYVADLGIVHRDLAARNILLDENKVPKISDFGLSRGENYVMKTTKIMPIRWWSIEAIEERLYTTASDVWGFGVVLWEIYTLGDMPYASVADENIVKFLRNGNRMEKPENCSDIIYNIMLECWSCQPKDRPKFRELHMTFVNLEDKKPFENASNSGLNGNDNTGFINSGSDETGDSQDSTETVKIESENEHSG